MNTEVIEIGKKAFHPSLSFGLGVFAVGAGFMLATVAFATELETSGFSRSPYAMLVLSSFAVLSFALAVSGLCILRKAYAWRPVVDECEAKRKSGVGSMEIDYGRYRHLRRILLSQVMGAALSGLGVVMLLTASYAPWWEDFETSFELPLDGLAVGRIVVVMFSAVAIVIGLIEALRGGSSHGRPDGLG